MNEELSTRLLATLPTVTITAPADLDVSQTTITVSDGTHTYTGAFIGNVCTVYITELGAYSILSNQYALSASSVNVSYAMQRIYLTMIAPVDIVALIPAMTGYTTPQGIVYTSSNNVSMPGWRAFDGNNSTAWYSDKQVSTAILRYTFASAVQSIRAIFIYIANDNGLVTGCRLQYSTDGTTFVNFNPSNISLAAGENYVDLAETRNVKAVQLTGFTTTNPYNTVIVHEVQFYGIN